MRRKICCQIYIFIFYKVQSILNVLPLLSGDQTDTQNSRSALRSLRSISVMEVNGKFSSASKSDLTETSEPILITQHHLVIKYQPERRKGKKNCYHFFIIFLLWPEEHAGRRIRLDEQNQGAHISSNSVPQSTYHVTSYIFFLAQDFFWE